MTQPPPCPVRGHEHALVLQRELTQAGTGARAFVWECPTGRYRWFQLATREFTDATRSVRPRFGWRDDK